MVSGKGRGSAWSVVREVEVHVWFVLLLVLFLLPTFNYSLITQVSYYSLLSAPLTRNATTSAISGIFILTDALVGLVRAGLCIMNEILMFFLSEN
jgi:hypothetical protein